MGRRNWQFTVEPEDSGLRLDQIICMRTGLSRRQAREALRIGGVQVSQRRVKVASKVLAIGVEVRVAVDDSLGKAPDLLIPVVFEDEWLLAVSKPGGLPCQGTQASDMHDMMAILGRQRPGQRLHLQHRLDQGTSGIIVIAKDPKADIGAQFRDREIQKTYLARTTVPVAEQVVALPVGRLRDAKPARFGCPGMPLGDRLCEDDDLIDPRPSETAFRPAEKGPWNVLAEPRTGRTHQIRVHLASIGAPILGDSLYGGDRNEQLWLHAWKLILRHPVTGETLNLLAEPERSE